MSCYVLILFKVEFDKSVKGLDELTCFIATMDSQGLSESGEDSTSWIAIPGPWIYRTRRVYGSALRVESTQNVEFDHNVDFD